jgi:phenylalanine-4-hydroxylase
MTAQPTPIRHDADSHPSFADPAYRRRRDAIAALAHAWTPGNPPPRVPYTAAEHATWRSVRASADRLHEQHASATIRAAQARVPLPPDVIPQLADVSAMLERESGFRLAPVAGLVPTRPFFAALAQGVFLTTQYVRHPSMPLYTPEPDVIHELVGHVGLLADPRIAGLARACGVYAQTADALALARLERVFWFALEFGACVEDGRVHALGAGLLSSVGELEHAMARGRWRSWDLETMAQTDYVTTGYQDAIFVAPSVAALVADVGAWLGR